MAEIAILQ